MKIEKRGDASQEPSTPTPAPQPEQKTRSKKPVIIYIMIMFIVAFLLMALSFFMHQRSNTEALGELQDSVNAMQAVQQTQEKVISLQEQLAVAESSLDQLTDANEALTESLTLSDDQNLALLGLYYLQQSYAMQDYEACVSIISDMESQGLVQKLPQNKKNEITAPYERFYQLKDAVFAKQ